MIVQTNILDKQVNFEADDLDQLPINGTDF